VTEEPIRITDRRRFADLGEAEVDVPTGAAETDPGSAEGEATEVVATLLGPDAVTIVRDGPPGCAVR